MKRVFLLLVILLLCQSFFADILHRSFIDAAQSYEVGNYRQALNSLNRIEPEFRYTADFALLMGKCYLAIGDYRQAHNWLSEYAISYMGKDTIASPGLLEKIYEAAIYQEMSPIAVSLGRMPGNINSTGSDYSPVLINNGDTMIFGSNRRSTFGGENIFISNFVNQRWTEPVELAELCTDRNETVGSISTDETILFIAGQYDRTARYSNIYQSVFRHGQWSRPQVIEAVSSRFHDIQPFVYQDEAMFFVSNRHGNNRNFDIYVSEYKNGAWQTPVNIGNVINTGYDEQTPFLSPDGQTLYFASNGHPGYGGFDIFKAERKGTSWTQWSEPVNLGPIINSNKDDRYYYISPDGRYAYLSSNRIGGIGHEDIYYIDLLKLKQIEEMIAARLRDRLVDEIVDDITVNGIVVNEWNERVTTSIRWNYIVDGEMNDRVIESDENGEFQLYVPSVERLKYRVEDPDYALREEILLIPFNTAAFNIVIRLVTKENEMKICGLITDIDEQGLRAVATWSYTYDNELIEYQAVSNRIGFYEISLPRLTEIDYRVEKTNYMPVSGTMEIPEDLDPVNRNFTLLRLAEFEVFAIDNIHFEFAKADLLPESYRVLDPIANMMINNPSLHIELSGHTDNIGGRDVNVRLSRDRAQSVANYLIDKGIDRYRIEIEGYGFDRPVADNETPEGRALNRRVELTITGIEYIDEEDDDDYLVENLFIPAESSYLIRKIEPTEYQAIDDLPKSIVEHFKSIVINLMDDQKANLKIDLLFDKGDVHSLRINVIEGNLTQETIEKINNELIGWRIPYRESFVHSIVVGNI